MTGGTFSLMLAALLAMLLIIAAVSDLRHRIISNRLNLAIALTAPLAWWYADMALWPDIALQIGVALAVFAAFVALFAIGGIGGGDVKMIGALALWIDVSLLTSLLMVMALVGGVIAAVMIVRKRLSNSEQNPELPYGVAIAAGGLWALHQQYLNHFPIIAVT